MKFHFGKWLLVGLLVVSPMGCEPTPVVVNPDGDDDTTIIEDDDADVLVVPDSNATPPADNDTGVKVDIGGGQGVDVEVDRDAPN